MNIGTLIGVYVWSIYGDYCKDNYMDLLPHSPFSTSKSLKFAGEAAPPPCHSTRTGDRTPRPWQENMSYAVQQWCDRWISADKSHNWDQSCNAIPLLDPKRQA